MPMSQPNKLHIILYVKDQKISRDFYSRLLNHEPTLDVPGMTEFEVFPNCILGIMPEKGIKRLLEKLPDFTDGTPRAEIYLMVDDPNYYHNRAVELGAKELSLLSPRDWGHEVAYSLDFDGHVLAFAKLAR